MNHSLQATMPDRPDRARRRALPVFRVRCEADLDRIPFVDGMAAVEVPAELLDKLDLKHAERGNSDRLRALERAIRERGYRPVAPVTARIGRRGRWVVVDGGHRLTAARHVMREFWSNLFRRKVDSVYFVLFLDPRSWSKTQPPEGIELPGGMAEDARAEWDRAYDRMRMADSRVTSG